MNWLLTTLFEELGVSVYAGSSLHIADGYPHTFAVFKSKYADAFKENGTPFVVAAIAGDGTVTVVNSLRQLFDQRFTISFRDYSSGIDAVIRVPKALWERVYHKFEKDRLYDLSGYSTVAST